MGWKKVVPLNSHPRRASSSPPPGPDAPGATVRLSGDATRRGRLMGDDGVTIIWMALLLVVLLIFAALAIDGGQAYQSGRQSQNAADSGAMAAVRILDGILFDQKTNYTSIASQAKTIGRASGADNSTGGVRCWIISFPDSSGNTTRISPGSDTDGLDMCSTTYGSTSVQSWVNNANPPAGGVEVRSKATRKTYFAGAAGYAQTAATRPAKAFSYSFGGGTGSPFVVCGVRQNASQGNDFSYDLLDKQDLHVWGTRQTDNKNALKFISSDGVPASWVGKYKYYTIQDAQVPSCGLDSSTFKGKGDGKSIGTMPYYTGITTGNGFENTISLAVAGITPCQPGDTEFRGCAMLIPIADFGGGTGSSSYDSTGAVLKCTGKSQTGVCDPGYTNSSYEHVVAWTAWMVYGDGSGSFNYGQFTDDKGVNLGANGNPVGKSCDNPIKQQGGGKPQYCGRLLGSVIVSGGNRGGPPGAGQPRIIGLGE
ncbi:MAG: hypothetical protein HYX32_11925 [Actinobacteria bacterium]|nr:hypothetical protein [Actinomycetota bacterium]